MSHEGIIDRIVTKFLLSTCRPRPQLTRHAAQAVRLCVQLMNTEWGGHHAEHPPDNTEADIIPLITGSVAEFYIEPMLPHIGDIDVMSHRSAELAIPRGHPPPTQLPTEFSNYVKVFEIVDSHLPGYVYLGLRYLLSECRPTEDDKFSHFEYDHQWSALNDYGFAGCDMDRHGPAVLTDPIEASLLSIDFVPCIRCLSWPSQAADWPTRHRNYDWPDSTTVDRVVNNGCDVVGVPHHQCGHDELMSKYQHRLSFSRAEIVLLNSWMPVQQIVYHMLRIFVKAEQLTDSWPTDNSKPCAISNYHIKTLMLWACELKSCSFWTVDLNLIRICLEMLHILSVSLSDTRCQHYFINNCNLIDNSVDVEMVSNQLMSINKAWLSTWFVNSYIQKCSALCPDNVSSLFTDVSTNTKLQNAVSAVVAWRLNTASALEDSWHALDSVAAHIAYLCPTVRSYIYLMTELLKTYTHLTVYFVAVVFLHVAYKISRIGFTDELMYVSAMIAGQLISAHRHPSQCSSELSLSKATKLMKLVANSSRTTMQLIQIELSKAYLHKALRCKDSDSNSIYCLANVYLAVLYYTTGQYQTALDHCTLVMRSRDHSQCSSHVVQGELLPKIDGDIDSMLGLAVLYQYVQTAALNQRQTQYVSIFTTEFFAHHLNTRYLSVTHLNDEVHQFKNYLCRTQLFITDILAQKSGIKKFHCQSITAHSSQQPTLSRPTTDLDTSELIELLHQSALEHLTAYRQLMARDFSPVATIVTTDFEAMYAYKHGDYQRCLQLSTQNVHMLLYAVNMPLIPTFPVFVQLLDDDIVSLSALTLIANFEYRKHTFNVCISQLTLSLYLMTQCQLKLRHSMTSLAQTLDYIEVGQGRHEAECMLDQLTLKLIKRLVLSHIHTRCPAVARMAGRTAPVRKLTLTLILTLPGQ